MAGEIPNPSGSAAMPLTDVMHLISVDDHLVEPPSLWAERLPAKFREAGGTEPMRYSDMIPGCYEPQARVIDMNLDGVQAALCFPSFPSSPERSSYRPTIKSSRCCACRPGTIS
jgi:hypothetical protein